MSVSTGRVTGVNGNMVNVAFSGQVIKNEVGYIRVGDSRLKGEIIRITGGIASRSPLGSGTSVCLPPLPLPACRTPG